MIGVLCNIKKKKKYISYFRSLVNSLDREDSIPLVVFDISDIDMVEKTVRGQLIYTGRVDVVNVKLPDIIYNLSSYHKRKNSKILRSLSEMDGVKVINETNKFKQLMVMDILTSFKGLMKYILPYYPYRRKETDLAFDEGGNWLLVRERGSSSKVIYLRRKKSHFLIFHKHHVRKCKAFNVQNALDELMTKNKWLAIKVPKIVTCNGRPLITRVYLQKVDKDLWTILGERNLVKGKCSKPVRIVYHEVLEMIKSIDHFIPNLGMCYMDFIFDMNKAPYFLGMGGWDESILKINADGRIHNNICKNMFEYFKTNINRLGEG